MEASEYGQRIRQYHKLHESLTKNSDEELSSLLEQCSESAQGIGGNTCALAIDSVPVFIKRIPLTDREKNEYKQSTLNYFDLPLYYQYGVGSRGFGIWREVSTHVKSTQWVLNKENTHFPLLYHWRMLPRKLADQTPEDHQEKLDKYVRYWGDSKSIRNKEEEVFKATSEVVLFLEYIPVTLHTWFKSNWNHDKKVSEFEQQILSTLEFMHSRGVYHFDGHFHNILTDGSDLYITDFGLANDVTFNLSQAEREFLKKHENYDVFLSMHSLCYALLRGYSSANNKTFDKGELLKILNGSASFKLSLAAEEIMKRWARHSWVIWNFLEAMRNDHEKQVQYPGELLKL
ncbi:MAG: protein kinase family protein [Deltaproteobacteria bacterium]|nr:protein kinase family protein [Deltaproteobacteria bacterium]